MEVHGYTETGEIRVTLDEGFEAFVPDDPNNRHRQAISKWEAQGNTIPPYAPPSVDLTAYAAQKRWEKEVGGINVGGLSVATDDRSKMMIIGARIKADADAQFTTQWKLPNGEFQTIDAATITAISDAVLAHVDNCFAVEALVIADIDDGTITTTEQIDTAFE